VARYDAAFLDELHELGRLAISRHFWLVALLTVIPTSVVFRIDNGVLFLLYFVAVCLWTRGAKLGGLIAWFIAAQTVFMYYNHPLPDHFVEILLRAPARASSAIKSGEHLRAHLPESFSAQLFLCLVFGLRAGVVGLGVGYLGRKVWGSRTEL